MMKTISVLFLAAAAFLPGLLPAAQVVQNGREAQQKVSDDGCIVFAYADGWDAYSKKRCEALLKSEAILKAAGNAVLVPMPVPENPDEATRKRHEEYCGGFKVPGANSYPALLFIDRDGRHYATLNGTPVARGDESALAELVADRLQKGRERRRLLAEAGKAQGPSRAKLLFKASQVDGLNWMGKEHNQAIRQADPRNESGVITALDFDGYAFARKLNGMELKEGLAEVERMLADKAYTPRQKQLICVAVLGMMRRKAGVPEADTMRRYTRMMRDFAPDTPEGKAAGKILREWIPGLNYARGWNPGCIPTDNKPVELEGKLPIDKAGVYTVHFQYTGGSMALVILGVELYDGKKKIAEDLHKGVAGNNDWQNKYSLKVSTKVKDPHLFIRFNQGNRDTYGKIHIERK